MRTVQITLEVGLVKLLDTAVRKLKTTRSAFTRRALKEALRHLKMQQQEQQHRQGYRMHPVNRDEVGVWVKEQSWGVE
jgi:metal-responsive CopG/Arc/MetJ family transcriptional regulator